MLLVGNVESGCHHPSMLPWGDCKLMHDSKGSVDGHTGPLLKGAAFARTPSRQHEPKWCQAPELALRNDGMSPTCLLGNDEHTTELLRCVVRMFGMDILPKHAGHMEDCNGQAPLVPAQRQRSTFCKIWPACLADVPPSTCMLCNIAGMPVCPQKATWCPAAPGHLILNICRPGLADEGQFCQS